MRICLMGKQTTSTAGFLESALPFDLSAVFCPERAFFELDSVSPLSFFGCCQTERRKGLITSNILMQPWQMF